MRLSDAEIVADDEIPGPEPEGFWSSVHQEVKRLAKLGKDVSSPEVPRPEG